METATVIELEPQEPVIPYEQSLRSINFDDLTKQQHVTGNTGITLLRKLANIKFGELKSRLLVLMNLLDWLIAGLLYYNLFYQSIILLAVFAFAYWTLYINLRKPPVSYFSATFCYFLVALIAKFMSYFAEFVTYQFGEYFNSAETTVFVSFLVVLAHSVLKVTIKLDRAFHFSALATLSTVTQVMLSIVSLRFEVSPGASYLLPLLFCLSYGSYLFHCFRNDRILMFTVSYYVMISSGVTFDSMRDGCTLRVLENSPNVLYCTNSRSEQHRQFASQYINWVF